jgi:hypothetical protein
MRNVVDTAKELEKDSHRKHADEKAANWLIKQAKECELDLDDDLKVEISEKLAGRKRKNGERSGTDEFIDEIEKPLFKQYDDSKQRTRNREEQRKISLKESYEREHKQQMLKKFGKSSYLTPESIMYLNQQLKAKNSDKLDEELVYAGLHSENVAKIKFKRKENKKQHFKGR